jgi:preprotein translocase subunit SecG
MLYWFLVTFYIVVCLVLLLAVLLQQGKGGDIAAAFGGGGGQGAFGARQGATVLSKAAAVLGALFMLGALGLAIVGTRGPASVMSGVPGAAPAQAPAPPTNPSATTNPAPIETPVAPAPGVPAADAGQDAPKAETPSSPEPRQ